MKKHKEKKEYKPIHFNELIKGFQSKIGATEYRKPIDEILDAFRIAIKRELDVDIKIINMSDRLY
jgi:hypothetical protein